MSDDNESIMEPYRIIKKYSNRRLYDTTISKSITLDEIKELVIKHIKFKIIDNNTEEDITNYVLLQIIMERESGRSPIFTTTILENFIRVYDNPIQKLVSEFLEKNFSTLLNEESGFYTYFQQNPTLDMFADLAKRNAEIWQSFVTSTVNHKKKTKKSNS